MGEIVEQIENFGLSKKNQPKTQFSKVGIIGCGTVGQDIAIMVSLCGMDVVFVEKTAEKIEAANESMSLTLDGMIDRWGMTGSEKKAILSRIKGSLDCQIFKGCDIVVEALKSKTGENGVQVRKDIFKNIEKYIDSSAIIATNAPTIMITELSSELDHPERCVCFHFLSPTAEARVVEVARGMHTTDEVYKNVIKFAKLINKEVVPVVESPGNISTRLIVPLINEACEVLMEGVGEMEDIDKVMRIGFSMQLGPFEMADKMGLDKLHTWMENLYEEFGDKKYKASPLIKKLVRANQLGRRTGRGFYIYDETGRKIINNILL